MVAGVRRAGRSWRACGVVGLKMALPVPPNCPVRAAVVAITWLVTISFVTVGLMLLGTEVPPANGWGCILVALATVPGDLNDPHYAGSALSAVGFVLEPLYLAAALRSRRATRGPGSPRGNGPSSPSMLGIAALAGSGPR